MSNNSFWGSVPNAIGLFSSLEFLDLGSNHQNGTVSPSLGQLSMLQDLDLSSNPLQGTLSNLHFSSLSSLTTLALSNNLELVVSISDDWVPPFQLDLISLSSCNMGPIFPKWLLNQTHFSCLDISNNGISEAISTSLWNISAFQNFLNLSPNEIYGVLPNLPMDTSTNKILDLSSNHIEGAIPSFLGYAKYLFLNDNKFSGSIAFLCPQNTTVLQIIDLLNNFRSGELPDCWDHFSELSDVRLDNSNFTGKLPPSLLCGTRPRLELLSIRNNSLRGELQFSFGNCSSLAFLVLGITHSQGLSLKGLGTLLEISKFLACKGTTFLESCL